MGHCVSNKLWYTIQPSTSLKNVGYEIRFLSEVDYQTVLATVQPIKVTIKQDWCDIGGGVVVMDYDDRVFTLPTPAGQATPILEQEFVIQVNYNGQTIWEFLAEDIEPMLVPENPGTTRTVVIRGRGLAAALSWAVVLPENMPHPTTFERTYQQTPLLSVWATLYQEAVDRGMFQWITPHFTASEDSNGNPWATPMDFTVSLGENYLDLLKKWCEISGATWWMSPGWHLYIWQGDGGKNRTQQINFPCATSQQANRRQVSRRELSTAIYAGSDQWIAMAFDNAAAVRWHKREMYIQTNNAGGVSDAQIIANASLQFTGKEAISQQINVDATQPGRRALVDFQAGDWITVEQPPGETIDRTNRVVGITVEITQTSEKAELELVSRRISDLDKLKARFSKLVGTNI